MGNKNLAARCPFRRPTSASAKIYSVLAKASKPLKVEEVAKRAKVSQQQARTLLAAYRNPYHNAPLRRAGVEVTCEDGAFSLSAAKASPNAKRPERGAAQKSKKRRKTKGKAKARRSANPAKPLKKASPKIATPDAAPAVPTATEGSAGAAETQE
jgi:hypothetical protein